MSAMQPSVTFIQEVYIITIFNCPISSGTRTKALKIADWEFSLFDRPSDEAQDRAKGDRSEFWTALGGLPEIVIWIPKNATCILQQIFC